MIFSFVAYIRVSIRYMCTYGSFDFGCMRMALNVDCPAIIARTVSSVRYKDTK